MAGRIPSYFEPNRGQAAAEARFVARGKGVAVLLGERETVLAPHASKPVKMRLEGSRPAALEGLEKQPGVSNYYRGNDPARWLTAVPHYARVKASGVYEGVDLVYYGGSQGIEYDFVVAPGADPAAIRLAYDGAERIRLDERGDLVLTTSAGELQQHKPRVYQEVAGRRVEVAAKYRLRGSEATFELARYDRSRPLVIDPILSYGSYLGETAADSGAGIGLDAAGAVYVGGTARLGYAPDNGDAFIAKLTPDGKTLVYRTYIGGAGQDLANGFAVQPSGNAFLVGSTVSDDFPVRNALQSARVPATPADGFVVKLDAAGAISYSTYLGGDGPDRANAIALDAAGNAFVAGSAYSTTFPGAPGPTRYQDAFVTKISPAGGLLFTSLVSGVGADEASGIALDATGIYITGYTYSPDYPVVPANSVLQRVRTGDTDVVVTKLKLDGTGLLYSACLGGATYDQGQGISVDPAGNAYVVGTAYSTDFPLRSAAYPTGGQAFLSKLNPSGTDLVYSTRVATAFSGTAVAVDTAGRAMVGGSAGGREFPLVSAWQSQSSGVSSYLARFNASGSGFEYATYVNGSMQTDLRAIFQDSSGGTWITGSVREDLTVGPQLPVLNGYDMTPDGLNAFVIKFIDGPPPTIYGVTSIPVGRTVIVDGKAVVTPATFVWQPGTPHTLDANSPQVGGSTQYVFSSWSQGGAAKQTVSAASASQTYTASYSSGSCSYSASPASPVVGFEGDFAFSITITTEPGCLWTATSNASWARLQPVGEQSGPGQIGVQVDPNPGGSRSADITFGSARVTLRQNGGSASLANPAITSPTPSQAVGSRQVTVSWTPVAGAATYEVRLRKAFTPGPALVFQGTQTGNAATSTTIDLPVGIYLLYVRACTGTPSDASCGGAAATDFRVALSSPSAQPQILFPSSGQTLTSSTVEFRWQPVAGAIAYQVTLVDNTGGTEMQIYTPAVSTIYSVKGAPSYNLYVAACQSACSFSRGQVFFTTNLAAVPVTAPTNLTATALSATSYRFNWNPVTGADIYRVAVIQPTSGPGGGALTVAAGQTASAELTLTVPPGSANAILAACTGRGCGPYTAPVTLNPPGPAPTAPVIGQPISVTNVDGPAVLFSWSRIPGDNGSNTTYRLYAADLSRNTAALDVQTTNNFYAAQFAAEGRRYDVVVAANPGPSQTVSAPAGFIVQGTSSTAPTPAAPTHGGTVKQGNVQVAWTPVPGAVLYQYGVFKLGDPLPAVSGMTPGLSMSAPLTAQGAGTLYSLILRSCPSANESVCRPDSDAGWGPWSNAPGGPGVSNFTVVP
ncbi:MAG: SBBP repeat-containing protein [Bryobacteraceae bacterium]